MHSHIYASLIYTTRKHECTLADVCFTHIISNWQEDLLTACCTVWTPWCAFEFMLPTQNPSQPLHSRTQITAAEMKTQSHHASRAMSTFLNDSSLHTRFRCPTVPLPGPRTTANTGRSYTTGSCCNYTSVFGMKNGIFFCRLSCFNPRISLQFRQKWPLSYFPIFIFNGIWVCMQPSIHIAIKRHFQ